jgi:hypothetical protein
MRARFAVAAVVLVAAAGAATAGAKTSVAPAWLAPVELTPRSDYSILDQQVAVDPRANVLAVWSGESGVQARYRPAGGAWQEPVQLAACGVGATAAFDAAGNATVVGLQCTSPVSQMTTAVRRVDGSWSPPVVLSTPDRSISYPHLPVAGSGAAVASWLEGDGQVSVVQASVRAPVSNDWSPAEQVSSVGADAEDSSVAVDDTGDAVVGFTRDDPSGALAWAAFKPLVGDWQRAVDLSQPGDSAYGIQVAMRPVGTAVAFWDEGGEGRLAQRPAATGTWSQQARFPLYSATWQQPVAIPSSQPAVLVFTIGFDGQRGLVAVWCREDTYEHGAFVATHRAADATDWDSPASLSNVTGFLWNVHSAIDVDGDGVTAFETQNGASVATAVLDAAAPKLRSFSFHQTGRVGQKTPLRRRAHGHLRGCLPVALRRRPDSDRRQCHARLPQARSLSGDADRDRRGGAHDRRHPDVRSYLAAEMTSPTSGRDLV